MTSDVLATGGVLLPRELETLRATCTMLHNETQTTWAHLLAIAIVVLFVPDIALTRFRY